MNMRLMHNKQIENIKKKKQIAKVIYKILISAKIFLFYQGHKRSSVALAIKKLQYAPPTRGRRLPSSLVSKGFTFSQGKLNLEVTLDREIYYHGEKVAANITVTNNSRKAVKNIKVCFKIKSN